MKNFWPMLKGVFRYNRALSGCLAEQINTSLRLCDNKKVQARYFVAPLCIIDFRLKFSAATFKNFQ